MRFFLYDDNESLSLAAAESLIAIIRNRPELVLGAASGESPRRMYQLLGQQAYAEPELFDRLRVVKLDEWLGLPKGHSATCETFLSQQLVGPLRISPSRYVGFDTNPNDPDAESRRIHDQLGLWGGLDVCVLGLGANGHVGLNEPADAIRPFAHQVALSTASRKHSMLEGVETVVQFGLTLGMAEILTARKLFLLVSGSHKASVLARLSVPEVSTHFPASLLLLHGDATCFCDRAAAAECLKKPAADLPEPAFQISSERMI